MMPTIHAGLIPMARIFWAIFFILAYSFSMKVDAQTLPLIHASGGIDVQLAQTNDVISGTVKVFASLRNFQSTVNVIISELNKKLKCGSRGRKVGVRIFSIDFSQPMVGFKDGPVIARGDLEVTDCYGGLVSGNVVLTVPVCISLNQRNQAIVLTPGPLTTETGGMYFVNFVPVYSQTGVEQKVRSDVEPVLVKVVKQIERAINWGLQIGVTRKRMKDYKISFRDVSFSYRGGDLIVEVSATGTISEVGLTRLMPKF